jgi:aspartate/methionine/tyrosine aminotransferase
LTSPGDNIIIQFPYYPAWPGGAALNRIKIKEWKTKVSGSFADGLKNLEGLIDSRTKAIVIGQPQVPGGSILADDNLKKLITIARSKKLYLIADEVCLLLESDKKSSPLANLYNKGISIGDLSKPFGAGGLRLGWLASADQSILTKCLPLRGYTTMSNSSLSEYLACLIINNRKKFLAPRLRVARKNYELLKKFLYKYDSIFDFIEPRIGVTLLVRLKINISSLDFCRGLIKKYNTLLVPGSVYGLNNYLRIGFGGPTKAFKRGLDNLEKYVQSFQNDIEKIDY